MWLLIDDEFLYSDLSDNAVRSGLEQILYAVHCGEHALAASPQVLRNLSSISFSPVPLSVIRRVYQAAPEYLSGASAAPFKVRVVPEGTSVITASGDEWLLPIGWVSENGVPSSALLGENLRDVALYKEAAVQYRISEGLKIGFQLEELGGGGADIVRIFAGEIRSKRRFVFCLTDSDRCCNSDALNSNSKECARLAEAADWICSHMYLIEREIENLIPLNFIGDALERVSANDLISAFEQVVSAVRGEADRLMFFDLKNGTKLFDLNGACVERFVCYCNCTVVRAGFLDECVSSRSCSKRSWGECECIVSAPLGNKIVDLVLDYLRSQSPHESVRRLRNSFNCARWLEVGRFVSAWGAAISKSRS